MNVISTLKTMLNKIISLNNTKIDVATMKALYGTKINLTTGYTMGSNWGAPSAYTAILMGDKLYIHIITTRTSNFSAGDITNELIGTFTCKTLGAISNAYSSGVVGRTDYSTINTMYAKMTSLDGSGSDQVLTFTLTLAATHAAEDRIICNFVIPVKPNVSYYNL